MTDNWNPETASAYHEATKDSAVNVRANPHFLDWANQPLRRAGDSPRFTGSERGSPFGQGGAPQAETN